MAKKRMINTEIYFDTEIVKTLGERGIHLYIRLWGIAEDWGGYAPSYNDIALQMGALNFSAEEVENFIKKLIKIKKIIPYKIGKQEFHWLKNFFKHQALNNPSLPIIPLPPWISCEARAYKMGKKYAAYSYDTSRLPVGYQYITTTVPVKENRSRSRIEKKLTGGKTESPVCHALPVLSDDFLEALVGEYPEVDVSDQLRRLNEHLQANPQQIHSLEKFVRGWMGTAKRKYSAENIPKLEVLPPYLSRTLGEEVVSAGA